MGEIHKNVYKYNLTAKYAMIGWAVLAVSYILVNFLVTELYFPDSRIGQKIFFVFLFGGVVMVFYDLLWSGNYRIFSWRDASFQFSQGSLIYMEKGLLIKKILPSDIANISIHVKSFDRGLSKDADAITLLRADLVSLKLVVLSLKDGSVLPLYIDSMTDDRSFANKLAETMGGN